jgi:hypothetical protein
MGFETLRYASQRVFLFSAGSRQNFCVGYVSQVEGVEDGVCLAESFAKIAKRRTMR